MTVISSPALAPQTPGSGLVPEARRPLTLHLEMPLARNVQAVERCLPNVVAVYIRHRAVAGWPAHALLISNGHTIDPELVEILVSSYKGGCCCEQSCCQNTAVTHGESGANGQDGINQAQFF